MIVVKYAFSENDANLISLDRSSDGESSVHHIGKNGDHRSVIGAYNRRIPRIGKYMRFGRSWAKLPRHLATQGKQLNTVNNDFQRLMRNFVQSEQDQVY